MTAVDHRAGIEPAATLQLWDHRRRVAGIYDRVRTGGVGESTWRQWREERDGLFATHPQSAIPEAGRAAFRGLAYHPYDPAWRLTATVDAVADGFLEIGASGAGSIAFVRFGRVRLDSPAGPIALNLYWLDGYGGGVFLPFRDATNGAGTYGGGRYLLDTAKGADLGHDGERLTLDFNFAYHPSCAHDDRWSCPLAPPENWLSVPVPVGERLD